MGSARGGGLAVLHHLLGPLHHVEDPLLVIAQPDLGVVVRVETGGEPLVVVPEAPRAAVLNLASAVLDGVELEALTAFLDTRIGVPVAWSRQQTHPVAV